MFTALVGGLNLGEQDLKVRSTKISYNSQLYSEYRAVHTLRLKNHTSRIFQSQEQAAHAKIVLFHRGMQITTAKVKSLLSTTPARGKTHISRTRTALGEL